MATKTWRWFEREWQFDLPAEKFPEIVERLRGTPARLEELTQGIDSGTLVRRDGAKWSILENVGHLGDLEPLWDGRLDDVLAGADEMRPADLTNAATHDANHNAVSLEDLLRRFRVWRSQWVARLDELEPDAWVLGAVHPRLDAPMRLIDLCLFVADHDDCHLAEIRRLSRRSD